MKRVLVFIVAIMSVGAVYGGDATAGQGKAAMCAACHGPDGNSPILDSYPKLGGQNAGYLEVAMKAYKTGERSGPNASIMGAQMAALSDTDIADIAAYFSSVE